MKIHVASMMLSALLSGVCLTAGEKVVCAAYSPEEPVIDGKLTEKCWKDAMFVSDFSYRATDNPLTPDETLEMGFVFTKRYLCMALRGKIKYPEHTAEFFKKTAALKKAGRKKSYVSPFSAELLFSPRNIHSSKQTWQILADSFGDHLVRHSIFWGDYPGKIVSAGTFDGKYWYYEVKVEYSGIKAGDIIPFNLMVNELSVPFANWQNYEIAFYMPCNMVGRILFGTPEQLKNSAYIKDLKQSFAAIKKKAGNDPELKLFFPVLEKEIRDYDAFQRSGRKVRTHKELSDFMSHFHDMSRTYQRLKNLYELKQLQ